jgi:hypothetical protein
MSTVRRITKPAAAHEEEFVDAEDSQLSVADAASQSAGPTLDDLLKAIDGMQEQLKTLKAMAKAVVKGAKKRKTAAEKAAQPKKEQSEQSKVWNAYVSQVWEELKGSDSSIKRSQAMAVAGERRAAADPECPLPPKPVPLTPEEKAAAKEAKKAAKAAEKAAKAPAKTVKPAAVKAAAAPAPAPAPAKPTAPATPPKAPAKAVAAPPAPKKATPPPAEDEEEEALQLFKHKGKTYLRSSQNECWLQGPSNTMGAWQGIYNPTKDTIVPAPEPEC